MGKIDYQGEWLDDVSDPEAEREAKAISFPSIGSTGTPFYLYASELNYLWLFFNFVQVDTKKKTLYIELSAQPPHQVVKQSPWSTKIHDKWKNIPLGQIVYRAAWGRYNELPVSELLMHLQAAAKDGKSELKPNNSSWEVVARKIKDRHIKGSNMDEQNLTKLKDIYTLWANHGGRSSLETWRKSHPSAWKEFPSDIEIRGGPQTSNPAMPPPSVSQAANDRPSNISSTKATSKSTPPKR